MREELRRFRGHIGVKEPGKRYVVMVSLPVDPKTGKNPRKSVTVRGSRAQAEKKLDELLKQMESGELSNATKTTVGAYLQRWLRDYPINLSPSTVQGYQTIIKRHLIPLLGDIPLQKLTSAKIAEYYRERQQHGRNDGKGGLSSTTVRQHAMVLHKALETAIQWGLLTRNPADRVTIPRPNHTEWQPFDGSGARRILEASKEHPLYPIFYLAIGTGLRRSEAMGLRWCDIDLQRPAIYVTRSLHHLHTGEYVIRPPKTKAGKRTVSLTPEVVHMLRKYRAHREAEAVMLGIDLEDQGLVFANADGSHIRPDYVSSVWRKFARKCGLRGVRFHDARHLHASLLFKQGVHPKIVQARLGHSSVKVTMDIYSHLMEGMQEKAIEHFDAEVFSEQATDDVGGDSTK